MNVHDLSSASSTPASRRRLLGLIAAGSAAAVATLLPRNGTRAGHGPADDVNALHLGVENSAPRGTGLHVTTEGIGLSVDNLGGKPAVMGVVVSALDTEGIGVQGISNLGPFEEGHVGDGAGTGVRGASGTGKGVYGSSKTHFGVYGFSETGAAIVGESEGEEGIVGASASVEKAGVHGTSFAGFGKEFGLGSGVGVWGQSGSGIGVQASSETGHALDVVGVAGFSTAGNDAVAAGQNSQFVANSAVTAMSHISVTLHGNPGLRLLRWVERSPASGFTVHFAGGSPGQRPAVPFSYLITEPWEKKGLG